MKKTFILTFAMLMILTLPISALAEGETTQVEGEVTQESSVKTESPDSFLYNIKRLYEQFRVMTTFDKESKLDLHLELAEKRLQELSTLNAEAKEQFSTELYAEFLANIEEAITLSVQLKEQQKEMDDTLQQLEAVVNSGEEIIARLESEVEIKIEEEEQETRELAKVAPAVVAHIDTEIITELRGEGFGYGQIALLVSMSEQSNVSLDEVKELVREHKGMGKVAKVLGMENSTVETEQELEAETSGTVDLNNGGVNISTKGKAEGKGNSKVKSEDNGKGQANGNVDIKTNVKLGIGIGNAKNDK